MNSMLSDIIISVIKPKVENVVQKLAGLLFIYIQHIGLARCRAPGRILGTLCTT